MLKKYFLFLFLSVFFCFVNGWRVFPLPDAPAPVKPTPVLPRFTVTTTSNSLQYNFVKPTPVLSRVTSTTGNYFPNKVQSVPPVLSSQDVPGLAIDLLPPKTEYTVFEP